MTPPKAICGLDVASINNIKSWLGLASENGFNFIRGPIVNPRYYRDPKDLSDAVNNIPLTRSDLILNSDDWCNMVLGTISSWIDCDSSVEKTAVRSEAVLKQELAFCMHLGLFAVSFSIHHLNHTNLARIIYNKTVKSQSSVVLQSWVHVPMVTPKGRAAQYRKDVTMTDDVESGWPVWRKFHALCSHDKNIGVILEVTADLPSSEELDRWIGEPIRALMINSSVFLTNKKGFPVLSKAHQAFVRKASNITRRVIITGINRHQALKYYVKYINYLFESEPYSSNVPNSKGYEDYLQVPLQPLMDNLESAIYETFEKDPVKYNEYHRAIQQALTDRTANMAEPFQTLMVVGAGRGPLVNAAISAAELAKVNIKIYVVEKNPNAYVTLCSLKQELWKEKVELFLCDMRQWVAPEKADIIISELLGSFGDNELSPECLDVAQKYLKEDGISIPCKYTSYLKPIQSSKLFNEVHSFIPLDKPLRSTYESPYVVHLVNSYSIAPEQPCFTFYHPNKGESNDRYKCLSFDVSQECVLHGFAGYFDTVLYKDIMLSIVPASRSKGMFSWFPMYFPLKYPVRLVAGDHLVIHMWRQSDASQVWYEWSITEPQELPVHNPNGRSYYIGLH